ncbi:MAG: hypothetical protein K9K84_06790 [Methylovulum sp.]|jgi:hypothetical protein|nr:hypothetical protein [Methylovulum sp.]
MFASSSNKPDLDWSQIRETVKLLTLAAAQVDDLMKEGDLSVNTLTESFTSLADHMTIINSYLLEMEPNAMRDKALASCAETSEKIQSSVIAFQFYDRMVQCLQHVTLNLVGLSTLIERPDHIYNPEEWLKLQNKVRSKYTMESEKLMFDAILQGKTKEEAIAEKDRRAIEMEDMDNIELF